MTLAVRNSRAPVAANPSLVAAGADVAEADPAQRIAAHPSVIDAERHPLYGHGVQHFTVHATSSDAVYANGSPITAEAVRQSRLSRWQEQR